MLLSIVENYKVDLERRIWSSHSGDYEEFYLLGYDAVSNQHEPDSKQSATCFMPVMLELFLEPEDGGDMFLRKADWFSPDYTASYFRR
jgi:hypothetical protein